MTIWDLDLLHLHGYDAANAEAATSPLQIGREGVDLTPGQRKYQWAESEYGAGAVPYGQSGSGNVERTLPLRIYSRFSTAITNLLTNPRPRAVVTGWSSQGTGSTVTLATVEGEDLISAVTTGSANSGAKHTFTATAIAHSAGVWVKVASGTAPIDVKFDGETATSITATTEWQLVKTENITLSAATRSLHILQTDTGSRTIYVKWACVHAGSTFAGFFDGASGDARWNGAAHASTSTCLTGQDAINLAIGRLAEKGEKAAAKAGLGGLDCYQQLTGSGYRVRIEVRAVDVSKVAYDSQHSSMHIADCDVKLVAHPYATGPEYSLATAYKAGGAPALQMLATGGKGDIAGPLRIKLTNLSTNDFKFAQVGIQARDYVSGTDLITRAPSFVTSGYSGALTAAVNEVQTLSKTGTVSGGTFTISLDGLTTAPIAYNASAATVQAALEALANIGSGNVACTGGPVNTTNVVITFQGDLAGCNINLMTVDYSAITGGGSLAIAQTTAGVPGYVKADLFDAWTAICEVGNLALLGSYRVLARVHDAASTSEIGLSQLRIVHGPGDLVSPAENDAVSPVAVGDSCLVDLGQVHINPAATGTQRYRIKIMGRTGGTAGNDLRVLDVMMFPVETGEGEVRVVDSGDSTLSMFDNFSAISGAITGDTATSGQTWASMGGLTDADDFVKASGNAIERTAVSDAATDIRYGRGVILGTATPTDVAVGVEIQTSTTGDFDDWAGVIAHFTDNNNFIAAVRSCLGEVRLYKISGGTPTMIASCTFAPATTAAQKLTLAIRASGAWSLTFDGRKLLSGIDAAFKSGVLSSGKSGLIDWSPYAEAKTRTYRDYTVAIPAPEESAAFAGQDLEFREDTAVRESSAGDYYAVPSGATVTNPPMAVPSGSEGITNRGLILASRFNPNLAADPYADPFKVELLHTPVYALARSEA